jgi:hypothetical protein
MAGREESKRERERDSRNSRRANERENDGRNERLYFSPGRGASLRCDIPRDRPLVLLIRVTM